MISAILLSSLTAFADRRLASYTKWVLEISFAIYVAVGMWVVFAFFFLIMSMGVYTFGQSAWMPVGFSLSLSAQVWLWRPVAMRGQMMTIVSAWTTICWGRCCMLMRAGPRKLVFLALGGRCFGAIKKDANAWADFGTCTYWSVVGIDAGDPMFTRRSLQASDIHQETVGNSTKA